MRGQDLIRAWFDSSPFVAKLGIRLVELTPDQAVVELPFEPGLATAGDLVHGGAISSLIDCAAAAAAWSAHDQEGSRWGTVAMSVNFMKGARAGSLTATARVSRRARTLCFCAIEVSGPDGAPVAEGLVTYRLG